MDQVLDVFFKRCYTCTVVVAGGEEVHRPFQDTEAAQLCVQEARRRESKDILFQDVDGGLDMLITDSVLRELNDHQVYFDTPGLVRRRLSFADSAGAGLDAYLHEVSMPVHSWSPDTVSDEALNSWLQASDESPDSESSMQQHEEGFQRPTLAWRLGLTTPQSVESEDYSRRSSIDTRESYKLSPVPVERADDDWNVHLTLPAAWKVAHRLAMLREQSAQQPLTFPMPAAEDFETDFYDVPAERYWNDPGQGFPLLHTRPTPRLSEKGFIPSGSRCSARLHTLSGHLGYMPQEQLEAVPPPSSQRQPIMLVGI